MKFGRVIGKLISTNKTGNIDGLKILVVNYLDDDLTETKKTVACTDSVGAGEDDIVLICASSSARLTEATKNAATDSTVVGIVDSVSKGKEYIYKKSDG